MYYRNVNVQKYGIEKKHKLASFANYQNFLNTLNGYLSFPSYSCLCVHYFQNQFITYNITYNIHVRQNLWTKSRVPRFMGVSQRQNI